MGGFDFVKTGERDAADHPPMRMREPLGLGPVEIDRENRPRVGSRLGMENADAARLDEPPQGRRSGQNERAILDDGLGPVIGHELRAHRHEVQCKRRLAAARLAEDENRPAPQRDGAGMERGGRPCVPVLPRAQIGSPTTKRAPSGSEVMSAWVGRMFSAQITPPCASTICLEIASPRPELLPKCSAGR